MANNRMYLHCPCGEEILLAKHVGDWYVATSWATVKQSGRESMPLDEMPSKREQYACFGTELDSFLDEHNFCGEKHAGGAQCGFTLRYDLEAQASEAAQNGGPHEASIEELRRLAAKLASSGVSVDELVDNIRRLIR